MQGQYLVPPTDGQKMMSAGALNSPSRSRLENVVGTEPASLLSPPPRRIVLVGTFYPRFQNAGNSTTGIATILAELSDHVSIRVFSQVGATLPAALTKDRVELIPIWSHDDAVSLIVTLGRLLQERKWSDFYLFNIYPRSFGRSRLANAVGLLIPVALKVIARVRVMVYMHNMVRTQDLEKLGYSRSAVSARLGSLVESLMIEMVDVVVPLRTQRDRLPGPLRRRVRVLPLNCIEAVSTLLAVSARGSPGERGRSGPARSCLLIGNWGPQKDLENVVSEFTKRPDGLRTERLTIVGGANTGFPEYTQRLSALITRTHDSRVKFTGLVPDDDLPTIFSEHDVLLLPYLAAGGYSGAMNMGAAFGMKVVAYDLEELREQAHLLHIEPDFVPIADAKMLLDHAFDKSLQTTSDVSRATATALTLASESVGALLAQDR